MATSIIRKWHVIDASEHNLGRIATKISHLLQGKHKPSFVKSEDAGDYVVVINSEKIQVTGNKEEGKIYDRYTGFPGGRKELTLKALRTRKPTEILYQAVSGMLPKNKLRAKMLTRLKLVVGSSNPYQAHL